MPSKLTTPNQRPGRLSVKVFFVMLIGLLAGAVIAEVRRFGDGSQFQPHRDWRHQWGGYGEALPTVGFVWLVGAIWLLWSWLARRREERDLVKKYGKRDVS
jgi:protein-S-isoprenylcysteine O-methyltransferase Ste14